MAPLPKAPQYVCGRKFEDRAGGGELLRTFPGQLYLPARSRKLSLVRQPTFLSLVLLLAHTPYLLFPN